jgi:hypothetical protein
MYSGEKTHATSVPIDAIFITGYGEIEFETGVYCKIMKNTTKREYM